MPGPFGAPTLGPPISYNYMYALFKNERSIQVWREANNARGMKQFKGSSYSFTQIISTKPLKLAVKKNKECI